MAAVDPTGGQPRMPLESALAAAGVAAGRGTAADPYSTFRVGGGGWSTTSEGVSCLAVLLYFLLLLLLFLSSLSSLSAQF